jgi:hypothetical protein
MLCEILLAIGLSTAQCVAPEPVPDQAAEVMIQQAERQQQEFEAGIAKRNKLYRGLDECKDCGKLNTVPFGRKE